MITGADFEEEEKKPGGFLKGERQVPTQRTGCKKDVDGERCTAIGLLHRAPCGGLSHWWRLYSLLSWMGRWDQSFSFSHSQQFCDAPDAKLITEGPAYDSVSQIFETWRLPFKIVKLYSVSQTYICFYHCSRVSLSLSLFFTLMEITSNVSISISISIYQNLKHCPTQRPWRKGKAWSTWMQVKQAESKL